MDWTEPIAHGRTECLRKRGRVRNLGQTGLAATAISAVDNALWDLKGKILDPGKTASPHDPVHTPGGSSSGSAAAVADFMVPLALGTETTQSTIRLLRRLWILREPG